MINPIVRLVECDLGYFFILKHDTVISKQVSETGDYAKEEKQYLSNFLSSGMTVLDVGSNIGTHAVYFSSLVGGRGKVYCFEPQQTVYSILCSNILLNTCNNVVAYPYAVGEKNTDILVPSPDYTRPNNFGGYSLLHSVRKESGKMITIDSLQLDQCDLLKIDVEGMELDVLRGAQDLLRSCSPVIYLECNRAGKERPIVLFLEQFGYRIYRHGWNLLAVLCPNNFQDFIDEKKQVNSRIFVSIACLSDLDVFNTIEDAKQKANFPERINFGVCLQISDYNTEFDLLKDLDNVSVDRLSIENAKGPIYARWRCEQLMKGEDYYLQIDCHSRFVQGWDSILVEELCKAEDINQNCVISNYPISIDNLQKNRWLDRIGHVNRYRHIDADGIKSHGSLIKLPSKPQLSLSISAALLFMRADLRRKFPYDPDLNFGLHAAEQVLYSIRLWTHGVDIFCPTTHTVATEYQGARDRIPHDVKRIQSKNRKNWPEATWTKVKYLLGLDNIHNVDKLYQENVQNLDKKYRLGSIRSVQDYFEFAKIDDQIKKTFDGYMPSNDS